MGGGKDSSETSIFKGQLEEASEIEQKSQRYNINNGFNFSKVIYHTNLLSALGDTKLLLEIGIITILGKSKEVLGC